MREDFLAAVLEINGNVAEGGVAFLDGLGDLGVEGADAIAQFIDELRAGFVALAFEQVVEIFFIGH